MAHDGIKWLAGAHVDKYSPDQVEYAKLRLGHEPKGFELAALFDSPEDGYAESEGNLLTTAGLQRITNLIIGAGGQALASARTAVGVGATATAANVADTVLGANTGSAWYQATDSTPTAVNGVLTFVSTFASADGNFAWAEWSVSAVASAITATATHASLGTTPQIINHKIASLGTKVSGASWVFTATITLS